MQPNKLSLAEDGSLHIWWSNGELRRYTIRELRDNCPCASCIEKRNSPQQETLLPVLRPEETQPLQIMKMEPAGRYAYAIHFSDGHDTGLFTLESLQELGTVIDQD